MHIDINIDEIKHAFPQRLPVFPLNSAVLLPGAVLPLHIFEPRYGEMVTDMLAAESLVAMAYLEPCDPEVYETRPPFRETVCVGRLLHHEALKNGRSNIALLGIAAGTASEIRDDHAYLTAEVTLREDALDGDVDCSEALARAFQASGAAEPPLDDLRERLLPIAGSEGITAALINNCALAAPIRATEKQSLLEESDVLARLDLLVRLLERPWQWN